MGQWYESPCAICPYYRGERGDRIVCEGMYDNSNIHQTFGSRRAADVHRQAYCYSWQYAKCPIARALIKEEQE